MTTQWKPGDPVPEGFRQFDSDGLELDPDFASDVDPLGPSPVEPDYEVPILDPGAVGVMMTWIFNDEQIPEAVTLTAACLKYEDHLRSQGIEVKVDPVLDGSADGDDPIVRISGFHEHVRAALVEYMGGDVLAADTVYHAAVTSVGTGSVVGGVEARFDAYNGMTPEYRVQPDSTTQTGAPVSREE